MDDFSYVLRDALEYYDANSLKSYDVQKRYKYYKINLDKTTITFFDKKKKEISTHKYTYIGKYNPKSKIWIWGWSVSSADKSMIEVSRRVLNYALDLDMKYISLKSELITSRHQVSSMTQIDILVALTAYLSKCPIIYRLAYDNVIIEQDIHKVISDHEPDSIYYLALI